MCPISVTRLVWGSSWFRVECAPSRFLTLSLNSEYWSYISCAQPSANFKQHPCHHCYTSVSATGLKFLHSCKSFSLYPFQWYPPDQAQAYQLFTNLDKYHSIFIITTSTVSPRGYDELAESLNITMAILNSVCNDGCDSSKYRSCASPEHCVPDITSSEVPVPTHMMNSYTTAIRVFRGYWNWYVSRVWCVASLLNLVLWTLELWRSYEWLHTINSCFVVSIVCLTESILKNPRTWNTLIIVADKCAY